MKEPESKAVGTEILFENERIRVWDMVLLPAEASALHRHECDYVYVYLTPSQIAIERPGEVIAIAAYDNGFVQYTEVGSGIEHRIRNRGDALHRQIILEFKGPSWSAEPRTPQSNGRKRHV